MVEELDFRMKGTIPGEYMLDYRAYTLELDIQWPEGFRYMYDGIQSFGCYPMLAGAKEEIPVLTCNGFSYNSFVNRHSGVTFVVIPEEKAVVFRWSERKNYYFVASVDSNVDRMELIALYKSLVDVQD